MKVVKEGDTKKGIEKGGKKNVWPRATKESEGNRKKIWKNG